MARVDAEVRLPALLQIMYGAPPVVPVTAATAGAAVRALDERWPGMADRILEPGGALRLYLLLFLDDEPAGTDTPLRPGACLRIVQSVAGG